MTWRRRRSWSRPRPTFHRGALASAYRPAHAAAAGAARRRPDPWRWSRTRSTTRTSAASPQRRGLRGGGAAPLPAHLRPLLPALRAGLGRPRAHAAARPARALAGRAAALAAAGFSLSAAHTRPGRAPARVAPRRVAVASAPLLGTRGPGSRRRAFADAPSPRTDPDGRGRRLDQRRRGQRGGLLELRGAGRGPADCARHVPLIVTTRPQPFEASPGLVRGVAPAGHAPRDPVRPRPGGRPHLAPDGRRRFVIAARGLPAGDQTITVAAYSRKGGGSAGPGGRRLRPAARRRFTLRPVTQDRWRPSSAPSAACAPSPAATDGVWVVDLRTGPGRPGTPAPSSRPPARSSSRSDYAALARSRPARRRAAPGRPSAPWSSTPRTGRRTTSWSGSAARRSAGTASVNRLRAALRARPGRNMLWGGYGAPARGGPPRPRRRPFAPPPAPDRASPLPPARQRPTAHDLGVMLSAADAGGGRARAGRSRQGISAAH